MGPRGRRARRRGLAVGMAAGAAMGRHSANNQNDADQAQAAAPAAQSDLAAQLEELQGLKNQGILTEEEFQAKKKQILGL